MIQINSTPNLTGVTIQGSSDDLFEVVDAIHMITVSPDNYDSKSEKYIAMSTRLLGLAYDIRHAAQGDREIKLIENGITTEHLKYHEIIAPKNNVNYLCNYLFPEMIFCIVAISELIMLRVQKLAKTSNIDKGLLDKKVVFDKSINALRLFQSAFTQCSGKILSKKSFAMWLKLVVEPTLLYKMNHQYMDIVNYDYMNMTKEKRVKSFHATTKRIIEYYYYEEYDDISKDIVEYAHKNNMLIEDVQLNIDYPEELEW